jgi:TRAP-type C4-dicarboxylate transport system substrate-binding protein
MKQLLLLLVLLASPMVAGAQQVIKVATLAPEGTAWIRELRTAAAQLQAGTQNRVQLKVFPGGVMGSDAAVLRKMRLGQLQGGMLTASELSAVYPDADVYTLPFLFQDWGQVARVRAKVDPLLDRGFQAHGLKMLAPTSIGFAYTMSTRPVRSIADLRASKLWIPPNDRVAAATCTELGASPVPLPLGDVFTGLQTGMVDTVVNSPASAVILQWHGKVRALVDTPVAFVVGFVVVDDKAWRKLSPGDQAVLYRTINAAADRVEAQGRVADQAALAAMKKQGLVVTTLDQAEADRWRAIGLRVRRKMTADGSFSPQVMSVLAQALGAPAAGKP